jgi:hypothetical protein
MYMNEFMGVDVRIINEEVENLKTKLFASQSKV